MTLNEVIDILYKEMQHTNKDLQKAYAVAIKAVKSWQKKCSDDISGQLTFNDILKEGDEDDKKK